MHYFITGTDTNAGKTYATGLLLESLRRVGHDAVGYKPFACGDRLDAHHLRVASGEQHTVEEINPVFFKSPASPYAAALLENKKVELDAARHGFYALAARHSHVLVEGAGGWEVPLAEGMTMADFAAELALPVILIVNNRLGCLNHALLTLRCIRAHGLSCAGVVLNHAEDERDLASISNRVVLERFAQVPVLLEIMHGESQVEWPEALAL